MHCSITNFGFLGDMTLKVICWPRKFKFAVIGEYLWVSLIWYLWVTLISVPLGNFAFDNFGLGNCKLQCNQIRLKWSVKSHIWGYTCATLTQWKWRNANFLVIDNYWQTIESKVETSMIKPYKRAVQTIYCQIWKQNCHLKYPWKF